MKLSFSIAVLSAFITITSCNNKKAGETVTVKSEDGKERVTVDMNTATQNADEMEKTKETLTALTPLSEAELKALAPETLLGGQRTDASVIPAMGTNSLVAEYRINNDIVELVIFDCAGPAGAGIYATQFESVIGMDREDEEEYIKTINLNGKKGIEHCQKQDKSCNVMYMVRQRLMVSVASETLGVDKLKQAAGELKL